MLSKINRLSLRTDRLRLEKEGITHHSPLFICLAAPSSVGISAPPRFVLLVTKKLAPLSVTRHHLKRLIHQIIRQNLDKFPSGYDFFLIPKKAILTATPDQILSSLLSVTNHVP